MRLSVSVVLACLASCMSVAPAGAARPASIPLRDRGPAYAVLSDAERWLVVEQPGQVTATDTWTGRHFTTRIGADCHAQNVHAGLLLLLCAAPTGNPPESHDQTYERPFVLTLGSGTTVPVPNTTTPSSETEGFFFPDWRAVGKQWLSGTVGCYHCDGTLYLNRYTGERRFVSTFMEEKELPARDLDDPNLGLARRVPLQVPDYDRLALTVTKGSHSLVLSPCLYVCGQPVAVGYDRYAWTEGRMAGNRTLRGYLPRSRRRFTWTIPQDVPGAVVEIVLTRGRISALVLPPLPGTQPDYSVRRLGRVVTAPWPR